MFSDSQLFHGTIRLARPITWHSLWVWLWVWVWVVGVGVPVPVACCLCLLPVPVDCACACACACCLCLWLPQQDVSFPAPLNLLWQLYIFCLIVSKSIKPACATATDKSSLCRPQNTVTLRRRKRQKQKFIVLSQCCGSTAQYSASFAWV